MDLSGMSWKELERIVYGDGQNFTKINFDRLGNPKNAEKRLRHEFVTSIRKGESFDQLVKRVQKVTGAEANDAKRIVRTETTKIENSARQKAAEDEEKRTGEKYKKRWFCTFHNSRDTHKQMHNQTVFVDEPFHTPYGAAMMYPGDGTNVGAGEIINCRCRMVMLTGKRGWRYEQR